MDRGEQLECQVRAIESHPTFGTLFGVGPFLRGTGQEKRALRASFIHGIRLQNSDTLLWGRKEFALLSPELDTIFSFADAPGWILSALATSDRAVLLFVADSDYAWEVHLQGGGGAASIHHQYPIAGTKSFISSQLTGSGSAVLVGVGTCFGEFALYKQQLGEDRQAVLFRCSLGLAISSFAVCDSSLVIAFGEFLGFWKNFKFLVRLKAHNSRVLRVIAASAEKLLSLGEDGYCKEWSGEGICLGALQPTAPDQSEALCGCYDWGKGRWIVGFSNGSIARIAFGSAKPQVNLVSTGEVRSFCVSSDSVFTFNAGAREILQNGRQTVCSCLDFGSYCVMEWHLGVLYLGTKDGRVLQAPEMKLLHRFSEKVVRFIATEQFLFCFDFGSDVAFRIPTMDLVSIPVDDPILSAAVTAGGAVLMGSRNGFLFSSDRKAAVPISPGDAITSIVPIDGEGLAVSSRNGSLYFVSKDLGLLRSARLLPWLHQSGGIELVVARGREIFALLFHDKKATLWSVSDRVCVASVDCGGSHRLWRYRGGTFYFIRNSQLHSVSFHQQRQCSLIRRSFGHWDEVKAVAFASSGSFLTASNQLALHRQDGSVSVASDCQHSSSIIVICLIEDVFITAGNGGEFGVWRFGEGGEAVESVEFFRYPEGSSLYQQRIAAASYSRADSLLVVATGGGELVGIPLAAKGKLNWGQVRLLWKQENVYVSSTLPMSDVLLCGLSNGDVVKINHKPLKYVHRLHKAAVRCLASVGGGRVYSGGYDGRICCWLHRGGEAVEGSIREVSSDDCSVSCCAAVGDLVVFVLADRSVKIVSEFRVIYRSADVWVCDPFSVSAILAEEVLRIAIAGSNGYQVLAAAL